MQARWTYFLILFLLIGNLSYVQIFCPANEKFFWPVEKVQEKVYEMEPSTDVIGFQLSDSIEVLKVFLLKSKNS